MMHGTRLLSPSWRMHAARMRSTVSSGLNMMASTCWLITIDLKIQAVYYHHNCLGSVDIVVNWPIWLGVEDPVHFLHLILNDIIVPLNSDYYYILSFWLCWVVGGWPKSAELFWNFLEVRFRNVVFLIALWIWRWMRGTVSALQASCSRSSFREDLDTWSYLPGHPSDAIHWTWYVVLCCLLGQDLLFTDTFQATVRNLVRHKKPVT